MSTGGYGFRIVDDSADQKALLSAKVQEWARGMEFLGTGYSAGGLAKIGDAAILTKAIEGPSKAGKEVADSGLKFTQTTASTRFSEAGTFSGKTIGEVANGLRTGALKATDVPVEYIERDGVKLIVNTRSSLALRRAGIPESEWNLVNKTGDAITEAKITERLARNELTEEGIDAIRITGSGKNASSLE